MKKRFFSLLLALLLAITILPLSVFAEEQPKQEFFPKVQDFEQKIATLDSYSDDNIYYIQHQWYYPYVKLAYEYGFFKYQDSDFMNCFSDPVPLNQIVSQYGYIIKQLTGATINYDRPIYYARDAKLVTDTEYYDIVMKNNINSAPAERKGKNELEMGHFATRKDIQILTNRLFDVVSHGEQINNLTYVVDVNDTNTPNVSSEGVLELYNYGILTGNSYGMFNPYQTVSYAEMATIFCRICFPEYRVKVSNEAYENLPKPVAIPSYKAIPQEYANQFMTNYGYNTYFTNQSLNETGTITKSELLTVAFSVSRNSLNSLNTAYQSCNISYPWDFTKLFPSEGIDLPASKLDAAVLLTSIATDRLLMPITPTASLKSDYLNKITLDKIGYIEKAITIGLIENTDEDLGNTALTKGEFSKMLTLFAEKYGTYIEYNTGKQGYKRTSIVTNPQDIPSNAHIFPYILAFAPKEVYESIPADAYTTPLRQYNATKKFYYSTGTHLNDGLSQLVNIDYRNLNTANPKATLSVYDNSSLDFGADYTNTINQYVQYAIDNEIILKGNVSTLFPLIYTPPGGGLYRLVAKVEFDVVSSKTNKNLLLFDENVTYNGNHFETYVTLTCNGTLTSSCFVKPLKGISLMNDIIYGGENITVTK